MDPDLLYNPAYSIEVESEDQKDEALRKCRATNMICRWEIGGEMCNKVQWFSNFDILQVDLNCKIHFLFLLAVS
jgi:hypothetical protein